ncbi:hypothetical protein [Nocardia sp. CNY236]|uniref:hypothetical protein n=1 Tax=Nocardia sp. CNY236 TaxID=1169152 RepID=UPI0004134FA6|nr:hypothetical protein [Nocardia sp. CNY236]
MSGPTRDEFIEVVQRLELPVNAAGLHSDFDQEVRWRSMHRVRLMAALCELRPDTALDVSAVFTAATASEVFDVFTIGHGR